MKTFIIFLAWLGISFSGFTQSNNYFQSLFNGKDLSGWQMPGEVAGFDVEKDIMVAVPHNGSDIFTDEYFGNYILRFDYLLSEVGNSGVLIRCDPKDPWRTGVEIQLLAPWTPYRDDLHCTGSIYGHVAVSDRPDETTGIWHKMEIKCDRKIITVSVDGQVTTLANIDTVPGMQDKHLYGAIGFQSNHSKEGEYAHFRNISVYDMDSDVDYVAAGFYDNDARVRKQAWTAAENLGPNMIGRLISMYSGSNTMAHSGAKQVLFNSVNKSTAPGASFSEKDKVIHVLKNEIEKNQSVTASQYLKWLLKMASAR